jgi:SAM-dependent methyltransferase
MVRSFLRLTNLCIFGSLLLPIIAAVCSRVLAGAGLPLSVVAMSGAGVVAAIVIYVPLAALLRRTVPVVDRASTAQARFLDDIPDRWVPVAIATSAAISLLLELSMIRWQGSVWEFFAFYKNFGLLSCFAGLGLGYALARRQQIPLVLAMPLLALQMLVLIALRHGMAAWRIESLRVTPFREQLNMGLSVAGAWPQYVAVYSFLVVVMILTALAFIPIGQLCGRLLGRADPLQAYGLNLLGSIAGVAAMFAISFLWTPPAVWFLIAFAALLPFLVFDRRVLLTGALSVAAALAILAWPVSFSYEMIYSPYQLLERGPGNNGLMMIRAAGHYYQRVQDLSSAAQASRPQAQTLAHYYELPYAIHKGARDVAVVGAGTGNDVAAALRRGAEHVDAIEIDPAIVALGALYHPERPYDDARVRRIVDDARSFLRKTTNHYDMVVYGLLDSHTLLSHASSVRLDSFVYTVEGLKEGRSRLKDGGVLSLSFAVLSDEIGRKIYLMMTEAFGGRPPLCIEAQYDGSVIFLQSTGGDLTAPQGLLESTGFRDVTRKYANPDLKADVSTDDWPFFYMPQRVYPYSYIPMMLMIVLVSAYLFFNFMSERPRFNHISYFLLGAGFMLIETKGITELGLAFGNTWQVIGVVIAGILIMAYLANLVVLRFAIHRPLLPYALLLITLASGLLIARAGGFSSTTAGKIAAVAILTSPMFFSGMIFSILLAKTPDVAGALAMNLLGAMAGGMLEYNSMYFGFRFLYVVAMALYAAALLMTYTSRQASLRALPDVPVLSS